MITREILQAQRGLYLHGREEARAKVSAFNGAIECLDHLLTMLDQRDQALAEAPEEEAATPGANGAQPPVEQEETTHA